jgi:hypothetical protein
MRFGVGQKRTAVAARSLSLVLVVITVGLGAMAAVYFSQGSSAATLNAQSSSSSLLSSSSVLSSSSSTTAQPAVQTANQSAAQYPLVWAPNPVGVSCDEFPFCIEAVLGFAGHTATSNITSTATTTVQNNTTTIVFESTTTYMSGVSTGVVYPAEGGSYFVSVWAFVQDAVTGQNVTTDGGQSYVLGGCGIQSTGFTDCYAGAGVPPGHTYKVTVYVTKGNLLPCSIRPAGTNFACTSQLLAPIQTVNVTE